MDKDSLFSIDEMSVLEALEIKGGAGSGEPTQNLFRLQISADMYGEMSAGLRQTVLLQTQADGFQY